MQSRPKKSRAAVILVGTLSVGVLATVAAAAAASSNGDPVQNTPTFDQLASPIAPGDIEPALVNLITTVASNDGEKSPTDIAYVKTSGALALEAISPGAVMQTPDILYVVEAKGNFVATHRGGLGDVPAPKGVVLTLAVDPATGHVFALTITDSTLPLEKLGAVIDVKSS